MSVYILLLRESLVQMKYNNNPWSDLQHHPSFAVGEARHNEAGAVAESHILGEIQGLEMFGLARGLRHTHFLNTQREIKAHKQGWESSVYLARQQFIDGWTFTNIGIADTSNCNALRRVTFVGSDKRSLS